MLLLTRKKLLLAGVGIISFYYLLNKFDFIWHSSSTTGIVVDNSFRTNHSSVNYALVHFECNKKNYFFEGEGNVEYHLNEKVPVIYSIANPDKAKVYSFMGFWYIGLIVCLVPLVFWCAFVLSFFNEEDKIQFMLRSKDKKITVVRGTKMLNADNADVADSH